MTYEKALADARAERAAHLALRHELNETLQELAEMKTKFETAMEKYAALVVELEKLKTNQEGRLE